MTFLNIIVVSGIVAMLTIINGINDNILIL